MKRYKFIGIHTFDDGEIGIETITLRVVSKDNWKEYGENAPKEVARQALERNDSGLILLDREETRKLIEALQKALKEDIDRIMII
ncbi:MAG: hypothetical protein QXI58_01245 [Candidatus Micrarchaeia archaeon]